MWNKHTISFEVDLIDLYKDPITKHTAYNVQSSEKLAARIFPPLPYCKENLQLRKFHFQYSDLNDSEYTQLRKILFER